MSITNWLPWNRERSRLLTTRKSQDPFEVLRRDMNRWFDEAWGQGLGLVPSSAEQTWAGFVPSIDVVEGDTEITVSAELPGMNEDEIELRVEDNSLVIRGEKEQSKEERGRNLYRAERSYGAFQRRVMLPAEVDTESTSAVYKKGVLTVTLPKAEPTERKQINVTHG